MFGEICRAGRMSTLHGFEASLESVTLTPAVEIWRNSCQLRLILALRIDRYHGKSDGGMLKLVSPNKIGFAFSPEATGCEETG